MISLPAVVGRELRVQARSRGAMLLRLLAGALATAGLAQLATSGAVHMGRSGENLFVAIHGATAFVILLITPILMADSICRERREGTFPLLFLTHLSPGELLVGKLAAQGIRTLSLWLAAAPVLLFPFVLGGISPDTALAFLTIEAFGMALGLLSGALGSSVTQSTAGAAFIGYAFLVYGGMTVGVCTAIVVALLGSSPLPEWLVVVITPLVFGSIAVVVLYRLARSAIAGCRQAVEPLPPVASPAMGPATAPSPDWFERLRIIERQMASGQGQGQGRAMLKPNRFERWVAGRRLRLKEGLPLAWMSMRRGFNSEWPVVWAALVGWLVLLTWAEGNGPNWGPAVLFSLPILYASSRALRTERECGFFEVLTVTPLPRSMLFDSHRALVLHQFRPALVVLALGTLLPAIARHRMWPTLPLIWLVALVWALPAIGFWVAIWCRSFVLGILLTAAIGVLGPALLGFSVLGQVGKVLPSARYTGDAWGGLGMIVTLVSLGFLAQSRVRRWLQDGGWGNTGSMAPRPEDARPADLALRPSPFA